MSDKTNGQPAATATAAKTPTLSKSEAVRRAMKALGMDATRGQIKAYAHDKLGMDLDPDHISSLASDIRRLARKKQKPAAKVAKAEKTTAPVPTAKTALVKTPVRQASADKGSASVGLSLVDVQAVKDLVQRLGADQLKGLIDVLTR